MKKRVMSVLGSAALLLAACGGQSQTAMQPPEPPVTAVKTAVVEKRNFPVILESVGHLSASAQVTISCQVEGELKAAHVAEGGRVKKGDLLFEIESTRYSAQLRSAQANLARNQAELDHAKKKLERHLPLLEKNFVSESACDELANQVTVFEAAVAAQTAGLEELELNLAHCQIRAPIDGVMGKLEIHLGNYLKPGARLTSLVQTDPIYVDFYLPENKLEALRKAQAELGTIVIEADIGSSTATGELLFIEPQLNSATGTISIRGRIANGESKWLAGQYAQVRVRMPDVADALVIPASAVQFGDVGAYIYVVTAEGTVRLEQVAKHIGSGTECVVSGNLAVGDKVVTVGQLHLYPGAKVRELSNEPV